MQCQWQKLESEPIEKKNKLTRKPKIAEFESLSGSCSIRFAPMPSVFVFWKCKRYRELSLIIWHCCFVRIFEIHLWSSVFDKTNQTPDARMWVGPKINWSKASVLSCSCDVFTRSNISSSDHAIYIFDLDIYIIIW